MKTVRIEDVDFDETEVSIKKSGIGNLVSVDFNPDEYEEGNTLMYYTPEAARKLAAALITAADEAEQGEK
ncbi:hypothetical protein [Escherichia phage vB_EcoM-LTH01]